MMTTRTPLECALLIVEISSYLVVGTLAIIGIAIALTGLLWFVGVAF